ncbi:hypothetical protein [Sinomicrobium weinanense]|uniref:Uncharacterized protein n=1 Tax=Sinomicrobium weinanense TaxID=2842200 RepID=A0A926JTA3_9FLAO|nr:hypothetical protein [Sinomicrobium weinanense]MBC9796969.1 hypothetical protein [Sinomicrobium weinanense]MBU3122192.1 ChaN family lipoprotein [Sinomicrobium weinanense]
MHLKNTWLIFLLIHLLTGCKQKRSIENIDYTTDYKFSADIENKVARDTVPWKYQFSASDYATKGDYKNALRHWDSAMPPKERNFTTNQIDSINLKYKKVSAVHYIVERAKENRVVMINEAHHNSAHRVFTATLLRQLYDAGYRNLGLEALGNGPHLDSSLAARKYPIQKTGYYIKDPQFGNLVRTALEIGYNVFPYEQTSKVNGKAREMEQAKNIQKVMENHPDEKFLIHCGFDHVLEGTHQSWEKTMAGRLKEYTGIDPFTIDQVTYSEKSNPKFNHPLLKALDVKESSVIIDKNKAPYKYERGEAWTDIAVFHPDTRYIDNRPHWLFQNGNKNVQVDVNNLEINFPVMVLAFKKGEDINNSVPVDIAEVKNRTENCHLGLKKGLYEIIVTHGKESLKFEQVIK